MNGIINIIEVLFVLVITTITRLSSYFPNLIKPVSSPQIIVTAQPTPIVTLKPVVKPKNPNTTSQTQGNNLPTLNGSVIFGLVNNYRASTGKPFLSVSGELCALAEQRADYMMSNNMEAFKSSGTGNHAGLSNISNQYSGQMIGENLGANTNSNTSVLSMWKNSPPHNELMLVTEKDGIQMTKGCIATRVSEVGSIVVLLVGDK